MKTGENKPKEKRVRAVDCLDFAVTFAGREYKALLPFVLAFHLPFIFIAKLLTSEFVLVNALQSITESDGTLLGDFGIFLLLFAGEGLMMVFTFVLQVLVTGAVIYHVYRLTVFGDRPAFSDTLKRGFRLFLMNLILYAIIYAVVWVLSLILAFGGVASLVFLLENGTETVLNSTPVLVAIGAGTLALAAAAIYLLARWGYTRQFIVCDNLFIFAAMKASWKATKKRAWHVICVFALSYILSIGGNAAVVAIDSLLLIPALSGSSFVISLVSAILTSVASVSFYFTDAALTYSYMERVPGGNAVRNYELGLNGFFEERKS